jgi:hypothetical protein
MSNLVSADLMRYLDRERELLNKVTSGDPNGLEDIIYDMLEYLDGMTEAQKAFLHTSWGAARCEFIGHLLPKDHPPTRFICVTCGVMYDLDPAVKYVSRFLVDNGNGR